MPELPALLTAITKVSSRLNRSAMVFLILTAPLLASGCGWHLRGTALLPESIMPVRIETANRYSDFYRELRSSLLASGARIVESGESAGATVHVLGDAAGQRVLSVSARNTPEEYQVFYAVRYSVEFAGQEVIVPQDLELTTAYSYDSRVVLGKQREQYSIQQALARDLAALVLRRLGSVKPQPQA